MNVFGVGLPEIAVISALALVIFGPKRLPELGRTLGKTLKGLQTASAEFEKEIKNAMADPDPTQRVSESTKKIESPSEDSSTEDNQNTSHNSPPIDS